MAKFDVVVVGGGPGGYPAAIRAAQKGLKVACVEKKALGGTCLNVGCIPSKTLLNASAKYAEAKHFKKLGIDGGNNLKPNITEMMKNKNNIIKGLTGGIGGLLKKNKVEFIAGEGMFKDGTLVVKKKTGELEVMDTKNVILATGSESSNVPGGGVPVDEKKIVTSTGALALSQIPKNMIVIGGGVIGLELGSVYSRLGCKVEVVEFLDKICPSLDGEIGKSFQKIMQKQGIKFHLSTKVKSAKSLPEGGCQVVMEGKDGKEKTMKTDVVLVSVGRKAYTDNLNLGSVGIKQDRLGRIEVDGYLAGKVKGVNVYAIGDVIPGPMLAHKAEEDGVACADGIATGQFHIPNDNHCPQVVYTEPEVGGVGKTEEQLKKEKIQYKVAKFPCAANSRSRVIGSTEGMVKVMYEPDTFKLLGAFVVGASAGELIHELSLIMHMDRTLKDVSTATFAHPTLSEAVKEAAMIAVDGAAIHFG